MAQNIGKVLRSVCIVWAETADEYLICELWVHRNKWRMKHGERKGRASELLKQGDPLEISSCWDRSLASIEPGKYRKQNQYGKCRGNLPEP